MSHSGNHVARADRLSANDLGQVRFDCQALPIDGGDFLLDRYDTTIRFERAKP